MRSPQSLVKDRQRTLDIRPRSRKIALHSQQTTEIVEADCRFRVIEAERRLTEVKGALAKRPSATIRPQSGLPIFGELIQNLHRCGLSSVGKRHALIDES